MSDNSQLDRVRRLFDDWATRGRAEGMELGHTPTARPAFESLELTAGQRCLDVGCGNGYTVRWAASVDSTVQAYGLDAAEKMISRARHLSQDVENARFIHAPFPLPMLKPQSFDAVFSMEVFYYLPDVLWGLISGDSAPRWPRASSPIGNTPKAVYSPLSSGPSTPSERVSGFAIPPRPTARHRGPTDSPDPRGGTEK